MPKKVFFISLPVLLAVAVAFGLLYQQNRNYKTQNQRLIVVNDSVLSENIELKNALRQRTSTVLKRSPANFKKENK